MHLLETQKLCMILCIFMKTWTQSGRIGPVDRLNLFPQTDHVRCARKFLVSLFYLHFCGNGMQMRKYKLLIVVKNCS